MPLHESSLRESFDCQRNDIEDQMDLIGADPGELNMSQMGLSAGLKAFVRRAIEKANNR